MHDETATMAGETHAWRVSGMDCASCAAKIAGAVRGLPGVADVEVSVMAESLRVRLDGGDAAAVERRVRSLGYGLAAAGGSTDAGPACGCGHDAEGCHDHAGHGHAGHGHAGHGHAGHGHAGHRLAGHGQAAEAPWHATAKGRLVLSAGSLLAAALGVDLLAAGTLGPWPWVAACLLGLAPVARRAVAAARAGQPFTIEMLMTLAAAGALAIGEAEEAAVVVFLFALGELLEGVAAGRARDGVRSLAALQPKTALVEQDGALREVPAASLRVGMVVLARPGDRIAADGVIVDGVSAVDQSPVTGESVPVSRGPGDTVFAGSIVAEAALRLRVSRPVADNAIARILRLVEQAESARAPTQRFIDRFARLYMPAIVALAVLVMTVPPLAAGQDWQTWIYRGLALLLIGCPCALVISTPASIASALSAGARKGLLMKGGGVLEAVAGITHVAFDKTGTLTRGQPEVTEVLGLAVPAAEVLALAASVEAASAHPLGAAIRNRAAAEGLTVPAAAGARVIPGRGVAATVEGAEVMVGSPRLAQERGALDAAAATRADALEDEGRTVAVVVRAGETLGLIGLRDLPRPDAAEGLRRIEALGLRTVMLTGDNPRAAAAVGAALGIEHRAALSPADKVEAVRALAGQGRLMMVGDGVNDAPALAAAQVGVAMGCGTGVALETAGAALLRDRVADVAGLVRLSRVTMATIRQNVAIALGLKAVFLATTVLGVTGLWIAVLADTGATVLVTLNALRLLRFDPDRAA